MSASEADKESASLHESVWMWLSRTTSPPEATRKRALADIGPKITSMLPPSRTKRRRRETDTDGNNVGGTDLDDGGLGDSSSSAASQSTNPQRLINPVKNLMGLYLRPQPILLASFDDPAKGTPNDLGAMLSVVERWGEGRGVIAESRRLLETEDGAFTQDPTRERYGPSPPAEAVARILELAAESEMDGFCEAHWNCRVHAKVLDLALQHELYAGKVDYLNCVTARIQPKSLLPPWHIEALGDSKVIDFAIYVKPSKVEFEAMCAMATRDPSETPSVNQTWHEPLQSRPISVSIVTTPTGEGWDMALLKAGVWIAAQLAKLKQLVGEVDGNVSSIPTLPLLVVQGHEWYFLAASPGDYGQTIIWSSISVGNTKSALGIYKVVAVIQYLAHWTQTVYRPWFFTNALGMDMSPS